MHGYESVRVWKCTGMKMNGYETSRIHCIIYNSFQWQIGAIYKSLNLVFHPSRYFKFHAFVAIIRRLSCYCFDLGLRVGLRLGSCACLREVRGRTILAQSKKGRKKAWKMLVYKLGKTFPQHLFSHSCCTGNWTILFFLIGSFSYLHFVSCPHCMLVRLSRISLGLMIDCWSFFYRVGDVLDDLRSVVRLRVYVDWMIIWFSVRLIGTGGKIYVDVQVVNRFQIFLNCYFEM